MSESLPDRVRAEMGPTLRGGLVLLTFAVLREVAIEVKNDVIAYALEGLKALFSLLFVSLLYAGFRRPTFRLRWSAWDPTISVRDQLPAEVARVQLAPDGTCTVALDLEYSEDGFFARKIGNHLRKSGARILVRFEPSYGLTTNCESAPGIAPVRAPHAPGFDLQIQSDLHRGRSSTRVFLEPNMTNRVEAEFDVVVTFSPQALPRRYRRIIKVRSAMRSIRLIK